MTKLYQSTTKIKVNRTMTLCRSKLSILLNKKLKKRNQLTRNSKINCQSLIRQRRQNIQRKIQLKSTLMSKTGAWKVHLIITIPIHKLTLKPLIQSTKDLQSINPNLRTRKKPMNNPQHQN